MCSNKQIKRESKPAYTKGKSFRYLSGWSDVVSWPAKRNKLWTFVSCAGLLITGSLGYFKFLRYQETTGFCVG